MHPVVPLGKWREREHRKTGRHEDEKKMRGKYLSSSSGLPFFPSSSDLRLFR
jgi:hypothetical protein